MKFSNLWIVPCFALLLLVITTREIQQRVKVLQRQRVRGIWMLYRHGAWKVPDNQMELETMYRQGKRIRGPFRWIADVTDTRWSLEEHIRRNVPIRFDCEIMVSRHNHAIKKPNIDCWFFHGTSHGEGILRSGFDARKRKRQLHGIGEYFSADFSTALEYGCEVVFTEVLSSSTHGTFERCEHINHETPIALIRPKVAHRSLDINPKGQAMEIFWFWALCVVLPGLELVGMLYILRG